MEQHETRAYDPDDFKPERAPHLAFPDDDWQWFRDACADFGIPDPDAHRETLQRLYSHLVHVNAWLNLTRITDARGYLKFHVLDSLSVLSLVTNFTAPGDIVLDLGSGGGYPGLPLMTWLPDRHFVLVDSRPKKVAFLAELPDYGLDLFTNKKSKSDPTVALEVLTALKPILEGIADWTEDDLKNALVAEAERTGRKNATVLWPLRIALAGLAVTPGGAIEIAWLLGRDESLRRLDVALAKLQQA